MHQSEVQSLLIVVEDFTIDWHKLLDVDHLFGPDSI